MNWRKKEEEEKKKNLKRRKELKQRKDVEDKTDLGGGKRDQRGTSERDRQPLEASIPL